MYLLKIEFKKLSSYLTFWVLLGISLLSTFLLTYWSTEFSFRINSAAHLINTTSWYQFPSIWGNVTWLCSYANLFFISIIVITLVCNEYTFKTIRQNVIDGLSKFEIVLGKIILIIGLSFAMTLFTGTVCLVFGLIYSEGAINFSGMFNNVNYLGDFFIQAIAYGMVAYFIATLFKRTGLSIVMFFVYKSIIESIIDWKFLPNNLGDYLPMNLFSELTPKPFAQTAANALGKGIFSMYSITSPTIEILAIVYIIAIGAGVFLLIKNRDL